MSPGLRGGQPFGVAFSLQPKGIVHAPLLPEAGRPAASQGRAVLEIFPSFIEETKGLRAGSRIWVLTYQAKAEAATAAPAEEGLPSLRDMLADPTIVGRHPLGIDQVVLLEITGLLLRVEGLNVADGTPIMDIQPIKGQPGGVRPRQGPAPSSTKERA